MRKMRKRGELPDSALRYVLEGLIPYTKANLALSFSPNRFFNDLEKISRQKEIRKNKKKYKQSTLRQAYYRAKRDKLIVLDQYGNPRLSETAKQRLKPYSPTKLDKQAYILVAFDIPESERYLRDHLRKLLKELGFEQVQRSVWRTDYDHKDLLKAEIEINNLQKYVNVYEASKLI